MSWWKVARMDLQVAIRSRLILGTWTVYVLAVLVLAVGLSVVGDDLTSTGALTHVISLQEWLIPAVGLIVGYHAIVGEREARTIQHLITVPYSPGDIILGKFLARSTVVITAILSGAVLIAVAIATLFPGFGHLAGSYAVFTIATTLFGIAMVALGIGISAVCRRSVRAVTTAMGAFVVFVFLWDLIPAGAYVVRYGSFPGSAIPPDWYFFLIRLNPIEAYVELLTVIFDFLATELLHDVPLYLTPAAMAIILIAWILGPLAVGYQHFRSTDIH